MEPQLVKPVMAAGPVSVPGGDPRSEAMASPSLSEVGEAGVGSLLSALVLTSTSDGELDPALAELVEQVTRDLQAGEPVDIDELAARHPTRAEMVRRLLPALRQLARLVP